jgi:hypothetical protein
MSPARFRCATSLDEFCWFIHVNQEQETEECLGGTTIVARPRVENAKANCILENSLLRSKLKIE